MTTASLFDIAADLDTPVSAFLKLKAFRPRFLLESVEGGERLARYSFIGFGDCLELRLDASGLRIGSDLRPRPADQAALLGALRAALAAAPHPEADGNGFPLHGGLVGVASYDLVRYFERLPARAATIEDCPDAHYVAPRSLLVFDHLTRRAALLHAGSEPQRQSLRREVIRAMRGGLPGPAWQAKFGHLRRVSPRGSSSKGCAVPRSRSPPATCTSSCWPCASLGAAISIPSRRIARCGCSTLLRTCITAS